MHWGKNDNDDNNDNDDGEDQANGKEGGRGGKQRTKQNEKTRQRKEHNARGEGDGDDEHDRDGGRRPLPPRTARRTPCPARSQRGRDERGERKDEKTREREKGMGRQGESGGGERNGRTKREDKNNREVEVVRFQRPSALLGFFVQNGRATRDDAASPRAEPKPSPTQHYADTGFATYTQLDDCAGNRKY